MCNPGEHKESVERILAQLAKESDPTATVKDLTDTALLELSKGLRIPCIDPSCFEDIAFNWAVNFRRSRISLVNAV
jgi:hypothetical protein